MEMLGQILRIESQGFEEGAEKPHLACYAQTAGQRDQAGAHNHDHHRVASPTHIIALANWLSEPQPTQCYLASAIRKN